MLSINGNVLIVFLIVWILVFVLSKIFFNPVRRVRDKREKGIDENRLAREKAAEAYEKDIQKIDEAVKQARAAADSIRQELETEAVREKARLLAEINAECRSQIENAQVRLNKEVEALKAKLSSEATDLAERIEGKLLS